MLLVPRLVEKVGDALPEEEKPGKKRKAAQVQSTLRARAEHAPAAPALTSPSPDCMPQGEIEKKASVEMGGRLPCYAVYEGDTVTVMLPTLGPQDKLRLYVFRAENEFEIRVKYKQSNMVKHAKQVRPLSGHGTPTSYPRQSVSH
jgi:hypothetical protein